MNKNFQSFRKIERSVIYDDLLPNIIMQNQFTHKELKTQKTLQDTRTEQK